MLKIAVVANTPPPYRVPMYNRIAHIPGVDLHVVFCSRREPNRFWDLPPFEFAHTFLPEHFIARGDRYIHHNPEVFSALRKQQADVIVTDGFNPTHLYGFVYAWLKGIPHIPMTDGTDVSERSLSSVHRFARRFVFARSAAFLSASLGGKRLYMSYGIEPERCFLTPLCVNNPAFLPPPVLPEKRFDYIFCSRFEPGKSPLFALDVAAETARRLKRRVRILFVGSGSLENTLREASERYTDHVESEFHGFATQADLPRLYQSAWIFLFPTLADVWGVVVNEACAAGLPVILSPHAGVVNELVVDGQNGYVRDVDARQWADCAVPLLTDRALWDAYSQRSLELVANYTFDHAAAGLVDACQLARERGARPSGNAHGKKRSQMPLTDRQPLDYRMAYTDVQVSAEPRKAGQRWPGSS
jgi:glycosyltransferase involved in cell wall biosynthesis